MFKRPFGDAPDDKRRRESADTAGLCRVNSKFRKMLSNEAVQSPTADVLNNGCHKDNGNH